MTRREIRDRSFKILFSLAFNDASEMEEQIALALEHTELLTDTDEDRSETGSAAGQGAVITYSDADKEYMKQKIMDIVDKRDVIDAEIERISEGWKLARIGKAELAILRLAVYEILYEDEIPVKVSINEAVELAKVYCDVEAKGFVNALLAKLA